MGILNYLRAKGIPWLGPRLSHGRESGRAITSDKITSALRSGLSSVTFLPWTNDHGSESQTMRRAYRVMLKDPIVKAAVLSKLFGTASLTLRVQPDGNGPLAKKVAAFSKWSLERSETGVSGLIVNILFGALLEKVSVCEKVFGYIDRGEYAGQVGLARLSPLDPDNFVVETDEHRRITGVKQMFGTNTLEMYPADCFTIWQHLPLYGVGISDLRAAYRAYYLLDTVWKLRGIFLDKIAMPVVMGKYKDETQEPALSAKLAKLRALSWLAVPEDIQVEAIELSQRSGQEWRDCILDLRQEVVIGIQLGFQHILEGSQTGARASAQVHVGQSELAVWYTSESVGTVLSKQVIPDITDLNYAGAGYPLATLEGIDDDDLTASLAIDNGLHAMGVDLDKDELYERYGRARPTKPENVLKGIQIGYGLPGMGLGGPQQDAPADYSKTDSGVGSELRNSVGGATALTTLQTAYYAGEITREAAIANSQIIFGMSRLEANKLFAALPPPTAPTAKLADANRTDITTGPAVPANRPFGQESAGGDTALAGADGKKAEALLAKAQSEGTAALYDVTKSAVKRLLAGGAAKAAYVNTLFNDGEKQQLADALAATNATAELLGRSRIRLRLAKAQKGVRQFAEDPTDFDSFAEGPPLLQPTEAVSYFKNLVPTLGVDPKLWAPTMERQAFTLAGVTETTLLKRVQQVIAQRLETGDAIGTAKTEIDDLLDEAGVGKKNPQRSEMIWRTNAQDAYNTGASREMQDPDVAEYFPVWVYLGIRDGRQGKDHEPNFDRYFPNQLTFAAVRGDRPFNCRCTSAPVSRGEWEELQAKGAVLG